MQGALELPSWRLVPIRNGARLLISSRPDRGTFVSVPERSSEAEEMETSGEENDKVKTHPAARREIASALRRAPVLRRIRAYIRPTHGFDGQHGRNLV